MAEEQASSRRRGRIRHSGSNAKRPRHLAKIGLLALLAVIGFDLFLHAGILASWYSRPSTFLRPPEETFKLIPLMR